MKGHRMSQICATCGRYGMRFSHYEFGIMITGINVFDDGMLNDVQQHTTYEEFAASERSCA